jgi:hypothetical protein
MSRELMSRKMKIRLIASACLALALAYPRMAGAQAAIGDVVTADATVKGSVQSVATGTRVRSGSEIKAGGSTASIRLLRGGGELRVCPRSTVSLTSSQSGRDLAIGMGTGGIETHYRLRSSGADTIMTPDFRILLAGPGTFEYAISADARGNTCVRSLGGNGSSIIVSEIMGDGTYQIQPGEQVYFRNGSVANPSKTVPPDCGCPPPVATMNAAGQPPAQAAPVPVPTGTTPAENAPAPAQVQPTKMPVSSPEAIFSEHGHTAASAPMPNAVPTPDQNATKPPDNEIHVQVDAPFVFRGDAPTNVPPAPQVATLRLVYLPKLVAETQDTTVLPPAKPQAKSKKGEAANEQQTKPSRKGFFGHVKSFFGAIFK